MEVFVVSWWDNRNEDVNTWVGGVFTNFEAALSVAKSIIVGDINADEEYSWEDIEKQLDSWEETLVNWVSYRAEYRLDYDKYTVKVEKITILDHPEYNVYHL